VTNKINRQPLLEYGTSIHKFIEAISNKSLNNVEIKMVNVLNTDSKKFMMCPTGNEQFIVDLLANRTTPYIEKEIYANGKTKHPFSKFKGKELIKK